MPAFTFVEKCVKSNLGVDPGQLAAQLAGINDTESPNASQSSSQHEYFTPSVSSQCSSPRSDPASVSSDRQRGNSSDDRSQRTSLDDRQTTRANVDEKTARNHTQDRPQRSSLDERSQRSASDDRPQRCSLDERSSRSTYNGRSQRTSLESKSQRTSLERSPRPSPRPSPRSSVEEKRKQVATPDDRHQSRVLEKSDSVDKVDKVWFVKLQEQPLCFHFLLESFYETIMQNIFYIN